MIDDSRTHGTRVWDLEAALHVANTVLVFLAPEGIIPEEIVLLLWGFTVTLACEAQWERDHGGESRAKETEVSA